MVEGTCYYPFGLRSLSLTLSLSCRITEPAYRYKMRTVIAVAIFNRRFNDYTLNDSRYFLLNLVNSR